MLYDTNSLVSKAFEALQMDNEIPIYQQNSSDEEINEDDIPDTPNQPALETPIIPSLTATPISQLQESKYISSNFTPTDDNIVYCDDYVIFGLKNNQNLIIRGQFILEIERGAITINNVVYHADKTQYKFLNPVSNALPLISATQVLDRSKVLDTETKENEHLFTSDYKSVIKITNLKTGLEEIGQICPLFKNLFWNFNNFTNDDLKTLDEFELAFNGYTFFPIIKPDNSITTIKYKSWVSEIERLTDIYRKNQQLKILVIGSKNCGKSTFLRLLLQNLLSVNHEMPVNILDLDPGQAEYSKPDSISLNKIDEFQHGNHLSLTTPSYSFNHYVGFSSPKDQPSRYNTLVTDLVQKYNNDGAVKNESLLINTPGWIKGYGTTLTRALIEKVKPTHVIYLNSGTPDLDELNLGDCELIPLLGVYQSASSISKYSSAQLRILKILSYLHKIENYKFDFQPLLFSPPLQVSYGSNGIKAVSILGLSQVHEDDIKDVLEGTIMGLHSISNTTFDELKIQNKEKIPVINSSELIRQSSPDNLKFKSLVIIHSIDEKNKLINLYTPEFENLSKNKNEEYILIRGRTEVPIWELASNPVLKEFKRESLPFITFEKNTAHDKVWKVRKNVQRRGQQ